MSQYLSWNFLQPCESGPFGRSARVGGFYYFMAVRGFKMASKSLLGKIVCSSFKWLPLPYSEYMWNFSNVFKCAPLFWRSSTRIVLWMVPKECFCSTRCWANFDRWLLVLNAILCSLKRVKKSRPVCPTYALSQSGHVSLYTPECVYVSVTCGLCINSLWIVLLVRSAILRLVFRNKFVIRVVYLTMYVK
jgi:hypothetical protein